MTRKRPTSLQVAERAGVSRTTVSFVLNDVAGMHISEVTRKRVLKAARELGYVPDAAARTLASGRTRTLGLIICHAEHLTVDAFIPQLLYSLNEASHQRGFEVLIEAVEDVGRPDAYLELVRAKKIDGLIVLNPRRDDTQLPKLIAEGFPIVVLGDLGQHQGYAVNVDGQAAARRATRHLVSLGHRRIAHITFSPDQYLATNARLAGYRQALSEGNLTADETLVRYGNYSAESGYLAMRSLLEVQSELTAVFAGNDTIALGAMAAIHQQGRRIPEDIAVVGYDDIPTAPFFTPPLTTIRSPAVEQGRLAMAMLIDLVAGQEPPDPQPLLEAPLIVRQSCGAGKRKSR